MLEGPLAEPDGGTWLELAELDGWPPPDAGPPELEIAIELDADLLNKQTN